MRFDYYSATVRALPSYCLERIKNDFEEELTEERPVNGYQEAWKAPVSGVRVLFGGRNPDPFFIASGEETPPVANWIRREFPDHRVSRADVCEDFTHPGGFDQAMTMIDRIVRPLGVAVCFIGDPDPNSTKGRTVYYGAKTSDVRVRIYEKGLKEISEGNASADPDWFRIEVQTRPRKTRKTFAADMSEIEFFGMSRWTVEVAKQALGQFAPFQPDTSIKRGHPVDLAFDHLIRQYGKTIHAFVQLHGREAFDRRITRVLTNDVPTS